MNPFDSAQLLSLMRRYLFCSICSVISLVLLAAIWILWQDTRTNETLNRERTQEGQAMLSILVSGPVIRQELARVKDVVQQIEDNLMVESKLEDNYSYFFKIQTETKADLIYLRRLTSDPAYDGYDYKLIPFSLQLSGTYEQLAAYILELETGPKLALIKTFSLRRRELGSPYLTLNLEVRLLGKK
jgi:Tfp pilus assembly protein PilO